MKREKIFSVTPKDFDVQAFRGSGPGGQHRNKTDSAIRIIHRASGAVAESQTSKSQHQNKRLAFKRLTETQTFKLWCNRTIHEITSGKTIDQRVEETMALSNMRIDVKDDNDRWVSAA